MIGVFLTKYFLDIERFLLRLGGFQDLRLCHFLSFLICLEAVKTDKLLSESKFEEETLEREKKSASELESGSGLDLAVVERVSFEPVAVE